MAFTAVVAENKPLTEVAVMVAAPFLTAVTRPVALTVATPGSELVHTTLLLVAPAGATVATSVSVAPTRMLVLDLLREIPVTAVPVLTTVTAQTD